MAAPGLPITRQQGFALPVDVVSNTHSTECMAVLRNTTSPRDSREQGQAGAYRSRGNPNFL